MSEPQLAQVEEEERPPIKVRTIHERYYEAKVDKEKSSRYDRYYLPGNVFVSLENDELTIKESPYEKGTTYHLEQIRNVIRFLDDLKL